MQEKVLRPLFDVSFSKTNSCPLCRLELPTDNPEYEEFKKDKVGLQVCTALAKLFLTLTCLWRYQYLTESMFFLSLPGEKKTEGTQAGGPTWSHVHMTTDSVSAALRCNLWHSTVTFYPGKKLGTWSANWKCQSSIFESRGGHALCFFLFFCFLCFSVGTLLKWQHCRMSFTLRVFSWSDDGKRFKSFLTIPFWYINVWALNTCTNIRSAGFSFLTNELFNLRNAKTVCWMVLTLFPCLIISDCYFFPQIRTHFILQLECFP